MTVVPGDRSIYAAAGGADAVRRIATLWHRLAVADPVVGHAFEHGFAPDHTDRLAAYLTEALGGPAEYTQRYGTAADVARRHAGQGVHDDFDEAGIALFDQAVDQAGLPDPDAAAAIKAYWAWATRGPLRAYPASADDVPADAPFLRWSWTGPATQEGYPEPPLVGDELDTLLGSLERMRATFADRCTGLDRQALGRTVGASQLTLAGLWKHLAFMEDLNFTRDLAGRPLPAPWVGISAGQRADWAFQSASSDQPLELNRLWQAATDRSRRAVADFLAGHDAAGVFQVNAKPVTLRRLLVDMIEEYSRHTGHADLLRESIDGRTGQDPLGPARDYHRADVAPSPGQPASPSPGGARPGPSADLD